MWHLKLRGGLEISEQQMRFWDNVPRDAEIERAALVFRRRGALPYVIELSGYERYSIARCVSAGFAGSVGEQGYALYGSKLALVTELEVLPSGMRMKMYSLEQCHLPERCWRNGHV